MPRSQLRFFAAIHLLTGFQFVFTFSAIVHSTARAAEFIPLGWLGEDPPSPGQATLESGAQGISDDGLAVIGGSTGADGAVFRWTPTAGMQGLRPGTFGTTPVISADGSTVAWSRDSETHIWSETVGLMSVPEFTNNDGNFGISTDGSMMAGTNSDPAPGFGLPGRWSRESGFQELPVPENVVETQYGSVRISADGKVVVGTFNNRTSVPCQACGLPFRWTEDEGTSVLGNVPGGILGTSADGSIVTGLSSAGTRLWQWTADAGLVVLEESSAGTRFQGNIGGLGSPALVSADGLALAINSYNSNGTGFEAHRWTEEGGLITLPVLPGYVENVVLEISNDGAVILGGSLSDSMDELWLWTEEMGTRALTDVLFSQGVDPNVLVGWNLTSTRGGFWSLAGNGNAVSGGGTNPDGIREAWVAYFDPHVIPEPSSLLLGTLALAGAVTWRGRRDLAVGLLHRSLGQSRCGDCRPRKGFSC